jgi:peptidoglycan/LPS O-acetylase OafA/YrhL
MQRREDIEGLRAVAVAAVLLFHAGVPGLQGGYVGVDVFFVLSGFLITSLLINERSSSGTISLSSFYARRVRRLLPVSSLVAVLTLGASYIWLEPIRVRTLTSDMIATAGFASNFLFAYRGADYLQSSMPPSPLQHYWSLAVEEQFYLVWPVLIAVVCLGLKNQSRLTVRVRVGVVSAIVAAASFIACMILMNQSQPWAFFSPHTRAFELALGALLAALPVAATKGARSVSAVLSWCGLAGIIVSVATFSETTKFPGPWALVPVMSTFFAIAGGSATSWAPVSFLRSSPLQWLGSRSYSAYLWHWPILIIAEPALGRELSVADGLLCTAIGLGLSEFSYRLVENPIRRNISIRGLRAAALAVSLVALLGGTAVLARTNPPTLALGPDVTTPVLATTTTIAGPTTTVPVAPQIPGLGSPIQAVVDATKATGLPGNLTPSLQQAVSDQPIIYDDGCHVRFTPIAPKPGCSYGDLTSSTVVGVYGDSHAAQWFPALEKIAIKRKWKLNSYTKAGCPPAEIPVYNKVLGRVYPECKKWRQNTLDAMVADGVKFAFVIHFDRLLSAATRKPMWQKEWRDGLQGTLDALKSRGITPILFEDTPWPGQTIPSCLSRNYTNVHECSPTVTNAYRTDMFEMRQDFDRAGENVVWVRHWFCANNLCPTIVGNLLVYRDDNHLTVTFASFVAPLLDEAVGPFIDWYSNNP